MNLLKFTLLSSAVLLSLGQTAQAASVRLLDADIGAAAAYFSQLTGNSYVVEFSTDDKISASRTDLETTND